MRTAIAAGALVVAAALAPAASADPVSGQDRQNAASACRALQGTMGASFAQTYRNFGACVSRWAQEQHQNRHEAEEACAAEPRRGGKFTRCVREKLAAESSEDVADTRNAAKRCKAERSADSAAFNTKYGGKANAFGKCVSQLAQQQDAQQNP